MSGLLPSRLEAKAREILDLLGAGGLTIATAESCTGGLIAAALTSIPGSSAMVERGFVTYSNRAKTEMLGVADALIAAHGAVSAEIARAMVEGALAYSPADIAVAVTGIAGPAGGSPGKPVGLVHMAAMRRGEPALLHQEIFPGGRDSVRLAAALAALDLAGRCL